MTKRMIPLIILLSLAISVVHALPKDISTRLGAGYFINGVDFLFPEETSGSTPLLALELGLRPSDSLWYGLEANLGWCRHEEWAALDPTFFDAGQKLNLHGRLDVFALLASARYRKLTPELHNMAFYVKGGLGMMRYRYQFTSSGAAPTIGDILVEEKKVVLCTSFGLGIEKGLNDRLGCYLEGNYLYPSLEDSAPALAGFAILAGISWKLGK